LDFRIGALCTTLVDFCRPQHVLQTMTLMSCYVIWLFVKRLSQEAIQRRSQRDRPGENKSLQTSERRRWYPL